LQGERVGAGITRHQPGAAEQMAQGVGGGEFAIHGEGATAPAQLTVDQHRDAGGAAVLIQRPGQLLRRDVQGQAHVRRSWISIGRVGQQTEQPPQTRAAHKRRRALKTDPRTASLHDWRTPENRYPAGHL
jgi:hypothetical protein